ncbi:hypothetical protein HK405_011404, partial [Cladochytrium tenue]
MASSASSALTAAAVAAVDAADAVAHAAVDAADAVAHAAADAADAVAHAAADAAHELAALLPQSREEVLRLPRRIMDSTVHFHMMPTWFQGEGNKYILSGYRRIQFTYRGCARSLLYVHNETGNIYTHLLGAILVLCLSYWTYSALVPVIATTGWRDQVVIAVFLASAFACLLLSTVFHTLCCHSCEVSKSWNIADYVGIVVLIVGSNVPTIYYGFYCERTLQTIYTSLILLFGLAAGIVTGSRRFAVPKFRHLRTSIFVALGLTGVLPLAHSLLKYGLAFNKFSMASENLVAMGAMYL